MKHAFKISILLVFLFFIAQVIGLAITNAYIDHKATEETGKVTFLQLPYDIERPPVEQKSSFVFVITAILIGTLLLLVIIKFLKKASIIGWWVLAISISFHAIINIISLISLLLLKESAVHPAILLLIDFILLYLLIRFKEKFDLWKIWFFLAVFLTLSISFSAFINHYLALILSLILAAYKIFKPNVIIHNLTEVFVYGGLAAIFVPIMNLFAVVILLVLISVYDFFAVFKVKHMITIARFQTESKVFAGLLIPYNRKKVGGKLKAEVKIKPEIKSKRMIKTAILGGGDIGFPLLFAGVVMKGMMLENDVVVGFLKTLIIPIFVSIALFLLFVKGKKDKFYPAMPFLTIGCFIGYLVLLLVNLV